MISVREAQELILSKASLAPPETVELEHALGKILAEDITADRDYPPFNRAAMDGYAFRLADYAPDTPFYVAGELFAGHAWESEIPFRHCLKIMTGAATPPELDCLLQVEWAQFNPSKNEVLFPDALPKMWQNIARKGEDCEAGFTLLHEGTLLNPSEIATLAVVGKKKVAIRKVPKVAILSTGDELVPLGHPVSPFQIRDSNAFALQAFFQALRIPVARKEIVPDDPGQLHNMIQEVLSFDMVLLSGGVSMGDADYVPMTLRTLGVSQIFHKVQLKPGKPLWFGQSPSGGVVFGLPGNPMSCQVCFKLFIEPYVKACWGMPSPPLSSFPLFSQKKKKVKLDEYFPVQLREGTLFPLEFNGSGDITSLLGSTGIALHPSESEDLPQGTNSTYLPWSVS